MGSLKTGTNMPRNLQYWLHKHNIQYDITQQFSGGVGLYFREKDTVLALEYIIKKGWYQYSKIICGLTLIVLKQ